MKRRDFLSLCGAVAGSCLIPSAVARLIHDTCILSHQPLIVAPPHPKRILRAIADYNTGAEPYTLFLGDPRVDPEPISWLEYYERFAGVDINDPKALQHFCDKCLDSPDQLGESLDAYLARPISGEALQRWQFKWEHEECPSVKAYDLLSSIPLSDGANLNDGNSLGQLSFDTDLSLPPRPTVDAPDLASLACLQHRLNELDQEVEVRIETW